MDKQANLKLSVQNFGPVIEGEFELKPLTIFIGPNNSGKSYMALLVYALCQAMSGRPQRLSPLIQFSRTFSRLKESEKIHKEFLDWQGSLRSQGRLNWNNLLWRELPPNVQQVFRELIGNLLTVLERDLDEAIQDYFSCEDLKELIRQTSMEQQSLVVHLNEWANRPPLLTLRLGLGNEKWNVGWAMPDLSSLRISIPDEENLDFSGITYYPPRIFISAIWRQLIAANGFPEGEAHYLPLPRATLFQNWQLFASLAVQMMRRRVGLDRIEMPPFTGVAGDFLQVLLERLLQYPRQRQDLKPMAPALEVLEGQVFEGEVDIEEITAERPLILYKSGNLQLPLQRASSMVGELAPLDLWIKSLLNPGDLLIIDEPEAHLHPENQLRIARVLIRLMRAGVRVLVTTHSSMILHQISNHLLATEADPKVREEMDFNEHDLLKPDEVGVYLFDKAGGSRISAVPIEPGFGISEEEFVRVAEAIGDETFRLSMALPNRDGDS